MNLRDIVLQSIAAIRSHKLRAALTMLGLTMGVATLIAVMTLIQGANLYVETKVANLGTNVFQVARTPFTVTDFNLIRKALRNRRVEVEHLQAISNRCAHCLRVGASASTTSRVRYREEELKDVNIIGHTASMSAIDTRTVEIGRYFTDNEDERSSGVCVIGAALRDQFFPGADPLNRVIRVGSIECTVVGLFERIGSLMGQDQDRFLILPLSTFMRFHGRRSSLTINVLAPPGPDFDMAMGESRQILRAVRHVRPAEDDDFFVATKDSYIALWRSISTAFFAVFVMVSAISSIVGGVVIMNVMLVSVTERTKEIGIRRAIGATQRDIRYQFLTESLLMCLAGGAIGILSGFLFAYAIRQATSFPVNVQLWVVIFGVAMSSAVGLFFGIYPAVQASRLDPVIALRSE